MDKSPTRTLTTPASYFLAAALAYIKLEALKLQCGIGHFRFKAQLYAVGMKVMYHQLGQLRTQHQLVKIEPPGSCEVV